MSRQQSKMQGAIGYFRANPQVFVLLVICVVLGLGTFIAVLIALATSPSDQTTGDPSGVILGAHVALATLRTGIAGAHGAFSSLRAAMTFLGG